MHVLITGPRGIGKSTLISKIITELNQPVWGFYTQKDTLQFRETFGNPVYIFPAGEPRLQTAANIVGYCNEQRSHPIPEHFDLFARAHLHNPPTDRLIVMDEIGSMESKATEFRDSILRILDGPTPVLAAVKDKDTAFLMQIRNHPGCKCFYISEKNRDTLMKDVLDVLLTMPN